MTQDNRPSAIPPRQLIAAMDFLRRADNQAALETAEAALPEATDRAPYLALASLAALRVGAPARAIPHLEALLKIHPHDQASQANLANALVETGATEKALSLVKGSDNPQLARIEGYIHQQNNEIAAAAEAYRRAVRLDPDDLSALNNLGNVLALAGETDEAIQAFERAITIAPAEVSIYLNLADLLREAERNEARLKTLLDAEKIAPSHQRLLIELGLAHTRLDDLESAIAALERAIVQTGDPRDAYIELGLIYESLNRVDDLAGLVARVDASSAPAEASFLNAWLARREGRFDEAAVFANAIPETIHPMRRFHLIGGIADRREDTATAFAAFEQMNLAALEVSSPLIGPSFREKVQSDLDLWSDEWASRWTDFVPDDEFRDPIFLVGFPRSGTTLLDTMLMGQPELSVLEERPMAARTVKLLGDEDLSTLSADRIHELRKAYFGFAQEYGWDSSRWLVDKHPLNMSRVPLLHRLFPGAQFIMAERHPYDVVLSCFMANFQVNHAMRSFTSLDEAARTYDAVFSAWERGRALFPIKAHPVRYERLVVDTESELAGLMQELGLALNDQMLDHTGTARERGRVKTASYSQIAEPLYTRATDRWQRYAKHLEPVLPILEPWAAKMGYMAT